MREVRTIGVSYAATLLHDGGVTSWANAERMVRWWARYRLATGLEPDVQRHLRVLRRGLRFPLRPGQGFELRPCGEARA